MAKKLIKDRDWHAWCWRYKNGRLSHRDIKRTLESWQVKWENRNMTFPCGGWVRVKLTIVEVGDE